MLSRSGMVSADTGRKKVNKVLCLRFPEQSALRWQASDCILLSGAMYVLTSHRHNLFADYSGAIAQIWMVLLSVVCLNSRQRLLTM